VIVEDDRAGEPPRLVEPVLGPRFLGDRKRFLCAERSACEVVITMPPTRLTTSVAATDTAVMPNLPAR
jgi:hypothetical protein